jgi:hypothetical protein
MNAILSDLQIDGRYVVMDRNIYFGDPLRISSWAERGWLDDLR